MAIVGYWKFEGNANDYSGNSNNGTATSITYSQANGRLNQGAGFNGSSSVIQVTSSSSIALSSVFTISAWVNPTALPPANDTLISLVCKYDNVSGQVSGYDFRLYKSAAGVQRIGLITASGMVTGGGDVDYTLSTGKWSNVVGVYNGSYSKIFINGIFIGQVANTITPSTSSKLLNIGNFGYYTAASTTLARWFNGSLDEIKIDNTVWSDAKIKNEYARIKGFF